MLANHTADLLSVKLPSMGMAFGKMDFMDEWHMARMPIFFSLMVGTTCALVLWHHLLTNLCINILSKLLNVRSWLHLRLICSPEEVLFAQDVPNQGRKPEAGSTISLLSLA